MIHESSQLKFSNRRTFLKRLSTVVAGLPLASFYHPEKASARIFGSQKSEVSFRTGTDRRELTYQALKPFQKEVEKAIGDRQVIIKANAGLAEPKYAMTNRSLLPKELPLLHAAHSSVLKTITICRWKRNTT